MIWIPFKKVPKNFLGIDIGTSTIKIVELSRQGERIKLENYGESSHLTLNKKPFRTFEKNTLLLSSKNIPQVISQILKEAKISGRKAVFSIPDFSSLFINFDLPPMTKEELPQAVKYEARQHIPLPLSDVTLDWQIVEGEVSNKKKVPLKISLVAIPNEVVNQYREIASFSNLELQSLEAEAFGLVRSLQAKEEKKITVLVDIGAQSTTVNITERGILRRSHSFDVSGNELTQILAKSFNVNYQEAENYKKKYGLFPSEKNIKETLLPLIDLILIEINKVSKNFYQIEGKEIQKLILAGGTSLLPGLKEDFSEKLNLETEIANPFANIFYPPILEKTLREMGPSYAIAVGMALRGFE